MSEAFEFYTDYQSDYIRPKWDSLTPEQKVEIIRGPGWVEDPAYIRDFEDVDSFKCHQDGYDHNGSNNFRMYFSKNTFIGEQYEKVEAFQRLNIIKPELVEDLQDKLLEQNYNPDDALWEDLLHAYKIMRLLVDRNDIFYSNDGKDDIDFLTR